MELRCMKTIIYTWSVKVNNLVMTNEHNYWGLGDIIRGMVSAGLFCEHNQYEYIIDTSLHPASSWLTDTTHSHTELIKIKNVTFIPNNPLDGLSTYIQTNQTNVITLMTNAFIPDGSVISQYVQDKVKHAISLKPKYNNKLEQIKETLNLPNDYNILHFRLGDRGFGTDSTGNQIGYEHEQLDNYDQVVSIIDSHDFENTLIMSDSQQLKNYIKKHRPHAKMYSTTRIAHVGRPDHTDNMLDTLLEFHLATGSKQIFTHSVYGHPSGFVNACTLLYNIDVINTPFFNV